MINKLIKALFCVTISFLFIWTVQAEVIKPDKNSYEYQSQSAKLNVVWKDYTNKNSLRPQSIICVLKNIDENKNYQIKLYENDAKFISLNNVETSSLDGMTISKGMGNWTLKIDNISNHNYKLIFDDTNNSTLSNNYIVKQSGTTVTIILKSYDYLSVDAKNASWLTTQNSRLYDASNNLIVLKGVVTPNAGTTQLESAVTTTSLNALKELGVNSIRITVQLKNSSNSATDGYLFDVNGNRIDSNQDKIKSAIDVAINNASSLGIYTIIDWGVMNANPMDYKDDAVSFFNYLASKYKDNPYVLYELCNEPSGGDYAWANNVKPYAEDLISVIRNQGSNGIVIVAPKASATAISSADDDDPISIPISEQYASNVAYSFHAYPYNYSYNDPKNNNAPGTPIYSWKLRDAVNNGLTVISTETATINATLDNGNQTQYDNDEMNKYAYFFTMNDISFNYFRYAFGWEASDYSEWTILKRINSSYYNLNGVDLYNKHFSNLNLENDFSKNYITKQNDDNCKGKGIYTNSGYWFYKYMTNDAFYKLPDYSTVQKKYLGNLQEEVCEKSEKNNIEIQTLKVPNTGRFISNIMLFVGFLLLVVSLSVLVITTNKKA